MLKAAPLCAEPETSTSVFEKLDELARTTPSPVASPALRAPAQPVFTASDTQSASKAPRPGLRQVLFRCLRLVLAGCLVYGAGVYFWNTFTQVTSEQAVVTTDIIALRAPIEGQLRIARLTPGAELAAGALAFRVENPRFGNKEAASQWNFAREQLERLQAETSEAALRLAKQQEIFAHHQKLHAQQLTAPLDYLQEEAKVALARAAWSNKLHQLQRAEARAREIEQQLALQKEAAVTIPFDAAIWAVTARDGAPVAAHETVVRIFDPKRVWVEAFIHEKYADKFAVGTPVFIRTIDGQMVWEGRVEAIRGRGGPSTGDSVLSVMPAEPPPGRMAARIVMEKMNPFTAREFYGVGRSVIVSLEKP